MYIDNRSCYDLHRSCYDLCSPEGSRTTVEPPAAKLDSKATALPVKEPEVVRPGQMQKDNGKDHVFGFRKFQEC